MHQAMLASVLASSSMIGTYSDGNSSAPPSDCGRSSRKNPRATRSLTGNFPVFVDLGSGAREDRGQLAHLRAT